MTAPNSREGIEEWDKIKVDIHSPFLVMLHSTILNRSIHKTSGEMGQAIIKVFEEYALPSILHQELQKARESERERIIYVTKNIKDAFMSPLTERRWLQCIQFTDQPKPKDQSELDQLDALTTLTPKT